MEGTNPGPFIPKKDISISLEGHATGPFNFDLFLWNYLIVGQHDYWNFTRTQIGTDYNLLNSQIKGSFSADTWPVVLLLLSRHVIPADHLKWINMEKTTHIVRNDEINQRFAAQI